MRKLLFNILVLLCFSSFMYAQQSTRISGTVTDENGTPLPGANIVIPALNLGAASDNNGKYSFVVPAAQSKGQTVNLEVGYVGYKSQTVSITLNGSHIAQNFSLKSDVFQSQTVVVTGIASKTSRAISEVSVQPIDAVGFTKSNSYQSVSQLLAGKIPGVHITHSSGNVGSGFNFYVRGGGGINGNEQPLIYLDGIRISNGAFGGGTANNNAFSVGGQGTSALSSLNPDDIASIQVLEGPAAAALYGTDASNGVVLITTKSGGLVPGGKGISVNYKYTYGFNEQSNKYSTDYYLTANAANDVFVKGNIRQHDISVSGGGTALRYYGSFSDRYEGGIMPNNNMSRKTVRLNLTAYPNKDIEIRLNSGFNHNIISRPQNDNNIYGFLGNTLITPSPYLFDSYDAIAAIQDEQNIDEFIGSAAVTYTPSFFKGFELHANAGIDSRTFREDYIYSPEFSYSGVTNGDHTVMNDNNRVYTYTIDAQYSYNILDNLSGTSVLGTQLSNTSHNDFWLDVQNFASPLITSIGAGSDPITRSEDFLNSRTAGIYFDNSFAYNKQIYFTLGIRRDYASSLGLTAPNIYYPKASVAIRLDKFNLVPSSFQLFKLRAAYGESGQLPLPTDAIPLLWGATASGYGGAGIVTNIGNSNIKPERIKEFEAGIDAEFLNNYSLSFTYYTQNASNSIIPFNNPPTTGLTQTSVPYNVGGVKVHGFESHLQADLFSSRDYDLKLGMIWNYQTNRVTSLGGAQPQFDGYHTNVIKVGLPKHEFYMFTILGPTFDANGKYVPGGEKVSSTQVDLGNPIPKWTGSFTINFKFLKNFNLYALFEWALDRKELNQTAEFAAGFGNYAPAQKLATELGVAADYGYTPASGVKSLTPGTAAYKAAADQFAQMAYGYDGNWVQNAQYLRLGELSLSYDLTDLLNEYISSYYISDLTIGFSASNVFTATPYKGGDGVDVNFDGSRSLTRGVDFLTLQRPRTFNFWTRVAF